MAKKKGKVRYKLPPMCCRICKHCLEDDDFIKEYKSPYVCGYDNEINPKFIGDGCEELVIGEWHLVEFLKQELAGIKEQLIAIINTLPGGKLK